MKFQIFPSYKMDGTKQWCARIREANGEIVWVTEPHANKRDIFKIIRSLKWKAFFARVEEVLK